MSLALWRSLEMWMQSKSLGSSARKVVAALLLTHLGLRLSKGSKHVQNVVEKNT